MGPRPTCRVCEDAKSKYKCPSCLLPYCSLSCFKKHKQFPCASSPDSSTHHQQQQQERNSSPVTVMDPEKSYYVDDPTELLQQFQLESLASSTEIHDILKDEKLQKLISDINGPAEPDKELDKAMEVDAFRIFAEKILSTLGSKA